MTYFNDFKKPVNIISLFIGVLGIILSLLFYFNGKKVKSISYSLAEAPSLIFDSKNSSSAIKLYEKDTVLIKSNVYLLTGTIWNSGNLPVEKIDIRLPVTLNLYKSNRILDFKITKQKDPSIANFVLTKISNSTLGLDWKFFDPNYGFSFQVIYEGDIIHNFQLKGKILDVSNFSQEKIDNDSNILWDWKIILILCVFVFFVGAAIFEAKTKGKPEKFTLVFLLVYLVLILIILWAHFFLIQTNPI